MQTPEKSGIVFEETSEVSFFDWTLNFWKWTVLGAPLWWVLGLNLMIYQIAAVFLFARLIFFFQREDRGLYLPSSCFVILFLMLIYFFSILIHAQAFPAGRVLASAYNLSYWMMGCFVIVVFANTFSTRQNRFLLKTFRSLGWIMGFLGIAAFFAAAYGRHAVIVPTPLDGLSRYFENADLLSQTLKVQLLIEDWFASVFRLRFNVFSPYPTATGGLLMITLMMTATFAAVEKKLKSPFFIVLFTLNFSALLMTLSRMSVAVFILSIAVVFLLGKRKAFLWVVFLSCVIVLAGPWLLRTTDLIWKLRQDSSETRFALYQYSLQQLQGIDWVLGLGIKNRGEVFMYPIGSHSTYVSLCVKTGILGLAAFILFQGSLLLRWFRLRPLVREERDLFFLWRGLGWVFIAMMFWTMTEDIDAPQLVAFLYFSLVGIFEGMRRELRTR